MPGAPHSRALLHRHHPNGRLNPTHRLMNVRPDGWCGGPDQGEGDVGLVFCVSGCVGSDLFEVCPEPLDPGAAVAGIALRRRGCAAAVMGGGRRWRWSGTSVAQAVCRGRRRPAGSGPAVPGKWSAERPSCACPAVRFGRIGRSRHRSRCRSSAPLVEPAFRLPARVEPPPARARPAPGPEVSHRGGAGGRSPLLALVPCGRRCCPPTASGLRKPLKPHRISGPTHPDAPIVRHRCGRSYGGHGARRFRPAPRITPRGLCGLGGRNGAMADHAKPVNAQQACGPSPFDE